MELDMRTGQPPRRPVYRRYEDNTLRYEDTKELVNPADPTGEGIETEELLKMSLAPDSDGVALNSVAHPEPDLNPASLETIEIDDPVVEFAVTEGGLWKPWQKYWTQPSVVTLLNMIDAGLKTQPVKTQRLYVSQEPVCSWIDFAALRFSSGRIFDVVTGFRGSPRKSGDDTVRSTYRELNYMEKQSVTAIKDRAQILINTLNDARRKIEAGLTGGGAPRAHYQLDIALQRAEECVMWATKALTG